MATPPKCSAGVQLVIGRSSSAPTSGNSLPTPSLPTPSLPTSPSALTAALATPLSLLQSAATKHTVYMARVTTATKDSLKDEFVPRWRRSMSNVWDRKEKTVADVRTTAKKMWNSYIS